MLFTAGLFCSSLAFGEPFVTSDDSQHLFPRASAGTTSYSIQQGQSCILGGDVFMSFSKSYPVSLKITWQSGVPGTLLIFHLMLLLNASHVMRVWQCLTGADGGQLPSFLSRLPSACRESRGSGSEQGWWRALQSHCPLEEQVKAMSGFLLRCKCSHSSVVSPICSLIYSTLRLIIPWLIHVTQ